MQIKPFIIQSVPVADQEDFHFDIVCIDLGGRRIGRPKNNKELLIGRAGRKAIEDEEIARDSLRWQRRKQTVERFREIKKQK
jgi:hypothetical protein